MDAEHTNQATDSSTTPTGKGSETIAQEHEDIAIPTARVEVSGDDHGRFVIGPFEPGYGVSLANPLRRVLYSGLEGWAITGVRIAGIRHEYEDIPHAKELVSDILANLKALRLRPMRSTPIDPTLRLQVEGMGQVCGADVLASADFRVANPEQHIATLDSRDARLTIEMNVERGRGYRSSMESPRRADVMPLDAIFTPVRKVEYDITRTRVGRRMDYENIELDVWTDRTIRPLDAVADAADLLSESFALMSVADDWEFSQAMEPEQRVVPKDIGIPPMAFRTRIDSIGLTRRTWSPLIAERITSVGEALQRSDDELLGIRNFGPVALAELLDRCRERGLAPADRITRSGN